jgi:hypothetical protein
MSRIAISAIELATSVAVAGTVGLVVSLVLAGATLLLAA